MCATVGFYCGGKSDDDVVQGSCIRFVVSMGEVRGQYVLRCDHTDTMAWAGEPTLVSWRENAMCPKRCEWLTHRDSLIWASLFSVA